jgi:hypothetical protein
MMLRICWLGYSRAARMTPLAAEGRVLGLVNGWGEGVARGGGGERPFEVTACEQS